LFLKKISAGEPQPVNLLTIAMTIMIADKNRINEKPLLFADRFDHVNVGEALINMSAE
jgi:hypothetical protein